jgi:hypothetical protein
VNGACWIRTCHPSFERSLQLPHTCILYVRRALHHLRPLLRARRSTARPALWHSSKHVKSVSGAASRSSTSAATCCFAAARLCSTCPLPAAASTAPTRCASQCDHSLPRALGLLGSAATQRRTFSCRCTPRASDACLRFICICTAELSTAARPAVLLLTGWAAGWIGHRG